LAEQALASVNKQLAALDLGSNSFHLLVAQDSSSRIQFIDKHKEMVRLAAGLGEDNELSEDVVERALDCLRRFAQRLRSLEVDNVRVVGTNTLRKAKNADEFIGLAEQALGHKIEIISGREEARLIYLGVCHDLGLVDSHRLVVDIGGGSTELILGRKSNAEKLESLHMGCVSMSQRHFAKGKLTESAMQTAINDALVELEPLTRAFTETGWDTAIGASGTINAVLDVVQAEFDAPTITREALSQLADKLIEAEHIDQVNLRALSDERRPVFPGGLAILIAIFDALNVDTMTTAQSALREGLIYDLLGRQHEEDARERTVTNLKQRYHVHDTQARQVRETAIGLLSQVAMDWDLRDPEHKHSLAWAADLHEIGMDISHAGFHKHGEYLLANMDMPGFSRSNQSQIALLVRAHRRKLFAEWFDKADPTQLRLTVLLRLAALLHRNRSHEALPHVSIAVSPTAKGDKVVLSVPKAWMAAHPLSQLDLDQEAKYLTAVNVRLSVAVH